MRPAESRLAVVRILYLFVAAASLPAVTKPQRTAELLKEHSARACNFFIDGAGRREYRLSRSGLADVMRDFSTSLGSWSFTEPINELCLHGLL